MRGDKLVIHEGHIKAARQIAKIVLPKIARNQRKLVITVAGESGSGKSEVASVLSDSLAKEGIKSTIFQQDDYFFYPPKTNANMRRRNIGHVGTTEVNLTLLDRNLKDFREGKSRIEKPLVIYDDDLITKETAKLEGFKVAIVDGTYTSLLKNVNQRVFINRTRLDTREARERRAREAQDEFLEKVLKIEHKIISAHKKRADILVTKNYGVRKVK
ncbi:MAG: zeta toxin family protein [Deltaproteobacteria bacterium]|nr:MAG: zeta toxin family protein [Deltaproteobacteria bacterium]